MERILSTPVVQNFLQSDLLSGAVVLKHLSDAWTTVRANPSILVTRWLIDQDPIVSLVAICLLAALVTWILSIITGNCSQV